MLELSMIDYGIIASYFILLFVTILILLGIDSISGFIFFDTFLNYYLHSQVFFAHGELFNYGNGILIILAIGILLLSMPKFSKKIIELIKNHDLKIKKSIFNRISIILCLVSFLIPFAFVAILFNQLYFPIETIFPWYIYFLNHRETVSAKGFPIPCFH